ncbi:hypothetical protein ADICYQ_2578 [Cyclobacterium qasimii M12-11B]|uniref:Uncharacterized protein n=1 Tax=Cyclobacterium qasimii M12-11B TaxID=641524 RepID=S7VFQ8_9BACT|nr:hypothetical protein ADICYQ_2578 [Cyclobacterium qasimii M12-11B]
MKSAFESWDSDEGAENCIEFIQNNRLTTKSSLYPPLSYHKNRK